MTSLTINITDAVARVLLAEAKLRKLTVEQVVAERLATPPKATNRKPTAPRSPLRREDPEAVIGSFADRPDLLDNILMVIEDRTRRYAKSD